MTTTNVLQSFPMALEANHVGGPTRATYGNEGPSGGARFGRTAHVLAARRADTTEQLLTLAAI
jgi:hypothetical protein